jgi:hypothetical protein
MDTKTCIKCSEVKPLTEFNFKVMRLGIRHARCRTCTRQQLRTHYLANRARYVAKAQINAARCRREVRARIFSYLKTHPCVDCREADPRCLDFDHVRGKKTADVSRMVSQGCCWKSIEREIAKCEVRCANCHRKRTAERRKRRGSRSVRSRRP